jgi:LacI family transcriptional regulator
MMENRAGTAALVQAILGKGVSSIGFVGDPDHCQSFFERWEGYYAALKHAGLEPDRRRCILEKDSPLYHSSVWILDRLNAMDELPGAFICANDSLAVVLLDALRRMGKSVPSDILVAGFDDAPESRLVSPCLTTVHIPSCEMGIFAADIMLRRIKYPDFPCSVSYLQTSPLFRESTGEISFAP